MIHTLKTIYASLDFNELADEYKLSDLTSDSWQEEILCDIFSLGSIMDIYKNVDLEGPLLAELENALVGILYFFTLIDTVNCALGENFLSASHPPAIFRREMMRQFIKGHQVYLGNFQLQRSLPQYWRILNTFRQLLTSMIGVDSSTIGTDANKKFAAQLSPFGRKAYTSLSQSWHTDWQAASFSTFVNW